MSYNLISQINETVEDDNEFQVLLGEAYEAIGVDRSKLGRYETLTEARGNLAGDPFGGMTRAEIRGGDRGWAQDLAAEERAKKGRKYGGFGGNREAAEAAPPQEGQIVLFQNGIGRIVAVSPTGITVKGPDGRSKFTTMEFLNPGPAVRGAPTWEFKSD